MNYFDIVLKIKYLIKYFGILWIYKRIVYVIKLKTSYFKIRCPIKPWESISFDSFISAKFSEKGMINRIRNDTSFEYFKDNKEQVTKDLLKSFNKRKSILAADTVLKGTYNYFGFHLIKSAFPPDWFSTPRSQDKFPSILHWSKIDDFKYGDIKWIWEINRFVFSFDLIKAFLITSNEKYPEAFWQLVEDWERQNAPNSGPNWKCGQEISFRVIAWCFSLYYYIDSATSTDERIENLIKMIVVSANRIDKNFEYALSQDNNHGISEAVGLFTIGILFPEFKESERWKRRGRRSLEALAKKLIYSDGAFSQHSTGYHRLMLQDYLWAIRLGERYGEPFSKELYISVEKAVLFLYRLTDPKTGSAPRYGQNDGSNILPLDSCSYSDFKPILQSMWYLLKKKRIYPVGPWDEGLFWLFGPESLKAEIDSIPLSDLYAENGGCYTINTKKSNIFIRCGRYVHRPAHADMLHIDIRWKGQPIAIDAGTYSYNAPEPWNNSLSETKYHNTITVDGFDQMDKAGRFLWFPWIEGKIEKRKVSRNGVMEYREMSHNGFERLKDPVHYRRGLLRIDDDSWLILDSVRAGKEHDIRLHWLISDYPYTKTGRAMGLTLHTPKGHYSVQCGAISGSVKADVKRSDPKSPRGWQAPTYHYKIPALSIACQQRSDHTVFYSLFSPKKSSIDRSGDTLKIRNPLFSMEISLQDQCDDIIKDCTIKTRSLTDTMSVLS